MADSGRLNQKSQNKPKQAFLKLFNVILYHNSLCMHDWFTLCQTTRMAQVHIYTRYIKDK